MIALRHVEPLEFELTGPQPQPPRHEYERRVAAAYETAAVDWLAVYADREHSQNVSFLTGFDPRFEEALFMAGPNGRRILIVGNEGWHYAGIATIEVDVVLCQSFSLMGQPRFDAPRLLDVLRDAGVRRGHRVGLVGWKYLEPFETDDPARPAFVPAFVVETLSAVTGIPAVDSTPILMHPTTGLRNRSTVAQLASFEWAATRASAAVQRVVRHTKPGMTEFEAVSGMGYEGDPLSCHVILASGSDAINGLRSPTARTIMQGDGAVCAIGYWGGLSCRAGMVTSTPDDGFLEAVVGQYFGAIVTWYQSVAIGAEGGDVYDAVLYSLREAPFKPLVNPGHQIATEEWTHTPIRSGSREALASGMLFQSDIIPYPMPPGWAINCEDTIAIADEDLRQSLSAQFPETWARILGRREFMRNRLGIDLRAEVLPLSSAPAYLAPFWGDPDLVCVRA